LISNDAGNAGTLTVSKFYLLSLLKFQGKIYKILLGAEASTLSNALQCPPPPLKTSLLLVLQSVDDDK